MSPKPVLYLVDASSYIHRAFHAIKGLSTSTGVPTNAVFGFLQMLLKVIKDAKPEYAAVVYDAKGTHLPAQALSGLQGQPPAPGPGPEDPVPPGAPGGHRPGAARRGDGGL